MADQQRLTREERRRLLRYAVGRPAHVFVSRSAVPPPCRSPAHPLPARASHPSHTHPLTHSSPIHQHTYYTGNIGALAGAPIKELNLESCRNLTGKSAYVHMCTRVETHVMPQGRARSLIRPSPTLPFPAPYPIYQVTLSRIINRFTHQENPIYQVKF